jgi:DNA-binding HxlR family transcriptional regulator
MSETSGAVYDAPDAFDVLNPKCPTQQVLDRVASKWTMLVILALAERTYRYAALRRRVAGVTQKMLTQTLRALERDGLVRRRVYDTVPVQTEYELTEMGRSLGQAVAVVRAWAYEHMDGIARARATFDAAEDRAPEERAPEERAPEERRDPAA